MGPAGRVFRHPLESETGWLAGAGCLADDDPDNDLAEVRAADPDILLVPDTIAPEQLAEAWGPAGGGERRGGVH